MGKKKKKKKRSIDSDEIIVDLGNGKPIKIADLINANGSKKSSYYLLGNNLHIHIYNEKVKTMGDEINISGGQQGAVGSQSTSQNNTFNQQNNIDSSQQTNIQVLMDELPKLKQALRDQQNPDELEHQESITAVMQAEKAIKENEPTKAIDKLKQAGKWAYGVAEQIGTKVVAEIIAKGITS